jgi:hypothetical protein
MPQEIKDHTFPQWALRGVKREQSSDGPVSDNLQIYEHTDSELFRMAMAQMMQVAAMGLAKQEKAQVRHLFG